MKHLVGAGVAITAIMAATGWAMAADMPLRAVAPAAAFDWSGMYIGGVVGGAWATNDVATPGLGVLGTAVVDLNANGDVVRPRLGVFGEDIEILVFVKYAGVD